jgi:hypothetical protein
MKERFDIFFKWISNIKNLVAVGSFIIGSGIFVIGMIAKHDAKVIQKFNNEKKAVNQEVRIDNWIKWDSIQHITSNNSRDSIMETLSEIKDSIHLTNKGLRKSAIVIGNLKSYMEDKVATKDGLKEVQRIFDVEKKNLFDQILPIRQNINILSELKKR